MADKKLGKEIVVKSFDVNKDDSDVNAPDFQGYLSTYGNTDRYGDIIQKGAFNDSLNKDSSASLLYQHDRSNVVGRIDLSTDDKGVLFKAYLNKDLDIYKGLKSNLKMGALKYMSIGMNIQEWTYSGDNPIEELNPMLITKAEILEGSIVTVPANVEAEITSVKTFRQKAFKKFNEEKDFKEKELKEKEKLFEELNKDLNI